MIITVAAFFRGSAFYQVAELISVSDPFEKRAFLVRGVVFSRALQQDAGCKSGKSFKCTDDIIDMRIGAGSQPQDRFSLTNVFHILILSPIHDCSQFAGVFEFKKTTGIQQFPP
jgi:hypothetical protein